MMEWTSTPKPAEITENRLIDAILEGTFPIGSNLPGERNLAFQLKVTRPTLREALQRLARDGWLEIRQGKPTMVKDYWHEGSLGVLSAIAIRSKHIPTDFVPNLLQVRIALAPAYTRLAVENDPLRLLKTLHRSINLPDSALAFAEFDWELHRRLTVLSNNPIYCLILNGFAGLYVPMAVRYFERAAGRLSSRKFYTALTSAAQTADAVLAERITLQVMVESLHLWQDGEEDRPLVDLTTNS